MLPLDTKRQASKCKDCPTETVLTSKITRNVIVQYKMDIVTKIGYCDCFALFKSDIATALQERCQVVVCTIENGYFDYFALVQRCHNIHFLL